MSIDAVTNQQNTVPQRSIILTQHNTCKYDSLLHHSEVANVWVQKYNY